MPNPATGLNATDDGRLPSLSTPGNNPPNQRAYIPATGHCVLAPPVQYSTVQSADEPLCVEESLLLRFWTLKEETVRLGGSKGNQRPIHQEVTNRGEELFSSLSMVYSHCARMMPYTPRLARICQIAVTDGI